MKKKPKPKISKEVVEVFRKIGNDKKIMGELSTLTFGFNKLNMKEQKAYLNHIKRVVDNAHYLAMREVFGEIYKKFGSYILQEVKVKDIQKVEKLLRKRYGYYKPKITTSTGRKE